MIRTKKSGNETLERKALRRRVSHMYAWFDRDLWQDCFSLIDPKLVHQAKVELPAYAERMAAFKKTYGGIHPWHIRISLHLDASSSKQDKRPFAYVYVVWQDDRHGFHMFRERWIKDKDRWYTRVMGLVPNKKESTSLDG